MRAGTLWSLIFQLSSKASVLVGLLAAAKVLSLREFGTLVACQGAAVVSAALLDFGSSVFFERELAAGRAHAGLLKQLVRIKILVVTPCLLTAAAVFTLTSDALPAQVVIATAAAGIFMNWSALSNGVLQGLLDFKSSALTQTVGRVSFAVGMLAVLVISPKESALPLCAWVIALSEAVLLASQLSRLKGTSIPHPDAVLPTRRTYRLAAAYWMNSVANLVYNRADATVVAVLAGASVAGVYAPASTIQNAMVVAPGVVTAGLPNVGASVLRTGGSVRDVRRVAVRSGIIAVAVGVAASAATIVAVIPLAVAALGPAYQDAATPAMILALSLPFYGAEFALLGYLVAIGRPELTVVGFVTALVVSISLSIALVPAFGASGAAAANLAREPAAVAALLLTLRHRARSH